MHEPIPIYIYIYAAISACEKGKQRQTAANDGAQRQTAANRHKLNSLMAHNRTPGLASGRGRPPTLKKKAKLHDAPDVPRPLSHTMAGCNMHADYACIRCMHNLRAYYACVLCMDLMHAYYACILCTHITHAMHIMHACMQAC